MRRPPAAHDALLAHYLAQQPSWLVSGSLVGRSEQWLTAFDLAFLWLLPALRLRRLLARYSTAVRAEQSRAFLAWAAGYDDNSARSSRTLAHHTAWLRRFSCPVLELGWS